MSSEQQFLRAVNRRGGEPKTFEQVYYVSQHERAPQSLPVTDDAGDLIAAKLGQRSPPTPPRATLTDTHTQTLPPTPVTLIPFRFLSPSHNFSLLRSVCVWNCIALHVIIERSQPCGMGRQGLAFGRRSRVSLSARRRKTTAEARSMRNEYVVETTC